MLRTDGELDSVYVDAFNITEPEVPEEECMHAQACYATCWILKSDVFSTPKDDVQVHVEVIAGISAVESTAHSFAELFPAAITRDKLVKSRITIQEPDKSSFHEVDPIEKEATAFFMVMSTNETAPPPAPPSDDDDDDDTFWELLLSPIVWLPLLGAIVALVLIIALFCCVRVISNAGRQRSKDQSAHYHLLPQDGNVTGPPMALPRPGQKASQFGAPKYPASRATAHLFGQVRGRPVSYRKLNNPQV